MQNNKMKFFTRLDGQGRRIPASGVLRLAIPKTGRWVEDVLTQCCSAFTALTATPADLTDTTVTVELLCDAVAFSTYVLTTSPAFSTIDELTAVLNTQLGFLGSFSNDGSDITLNLSLEIGQNMCTGTITMTIV